MNTPGVSRFGGAGQWKKSMQSGDGLIFLGFIPPSHARVCLTTTSLRFFFLYFGDSDQGWIIKARAKASGPLFKILTVALSLIVLQRTQRQTLCVCVCDRVYFSHSVRAKFDISSLRTRSINKYFAVYSLTTYVIWPTCGRQGKSRLLSWHHRQAIISKLCKVDGPCLLDLEK